MSILGMSLGVLVALCMSAMTVINPNFTPVNLVKQMQTILVVHITEAENGQYLADVSEVLKGEFKGESITLGFSDSSLEEQAIKIQNEMKNEKNNYALIFIGNIDTSGNGDLSVQGASQPAFLHINGIWAEFKLRDASADFLKLDVDKQAVWRGGTDMLLQCCRYILSNPNAVVPVAANAEWAETKEIATLDERINKIYPISINTDSTKQQLFIAADNGDRLYEYNSEDDEFVDLTELVQLQSRSKLSAWADCNSDGILDLISWNGEEVQLYLRDENGTFSSVQKVLSTSCLSLQVISYSNENELGLVIGTSTGPQLIDLEDNTLKHIFKPAGELNSTLGEAGPCLLADLNNDGHVDVLHLYAAGSILYKGQGIGSWGDPELKNVTLGAAPNGVFTADFDADGLLDVVTYGQHDAGISIYQNHGDFLFERANGLCGETNNVGNGVISGMVGDINNDGRQDFVVFYSDMSDEPRDPQIFFNRGFRSFGFATDLNLSETSMLYDAASGQQAGCWCDLNNDGAQDIVIVDGVNTVGVVFRNNVQEDALCLSIGVSADMNYTGPIMVTAFNDDRNLGSWSIDQSSPSARFCAREAGEFRVRWHIPGAGLCEETVIVEEGSKRCLLKADALQEIEP